MKIILLLIFALFSLFSSYDCKKNNNYKPKCDCGIIPKGVTKKTKNSRIFKGKDATLYQFPWQVWIEVDFIARDRIVQQGGVLISKGHILTASHIFYYNYGINEGIHMINFIGKKAIDLKRCLNIFPHIYNQYISAK